MGMKDIGQGIKTRLHTIHDLKVYAIDELPDSVNQFPAALIMPGETEYTTTFDPHDADYNFRVILLFSKADQPSAINRMLPYLAVSGERSIVEAIHEEDTLDGSADSSKVTRNLGIGSLIWGNTTYLSTEFTVQVWAND